MPDMVCEFSKEFPLRIATRKSALAVAQTTLAADALVSANPGLAYELVPMTTEGDRRLDRSLSSFGGKGVFIKELEVALLEGRADIAIHSLKDMPAEVMPEFKLAAVLKRSSSWTCLRERVSVPEASAAWCS